MTDGWREMRLIFRLCCVVTLLHTGCALRPEKNARNEIAVAALRYRFREAPYQEAIRVRLDGEGVDMTDVISRTALADRRVILVATENAKAWESRFRRNLADPSTGLLHLSINCFSRTTAQVFIKCEWESATVTYTQKLKREKSGWMVVNENLDDVE